MRHIKKLASRKTCTGCMVCVDACNVEALIPEHGEDGHIYPKYDNGKCNECGLCVKVCPVVNKYKYSSENNSGLYAAWAKDDEIRANSTSGGVFAAIAKKVISNGGYVAGAAFFGTNVRHIVINEISDISRLQGSKYLQSDSTGVYLKVKKLLLNEETVFFSGLPCQVAGLLSYLGEEKKNLITADLICNGVPSSLLIDRLKKDYHEELVSISYRDKGNGWLNGGNKYNIKNKDGVCVSITDKRFDLVMDGFISNFTNRFSCYDCEYSKINRKADLTLGDFWGFNKFLEQQYLGVSLVVVHSEKGNLYLKDSDIQSYKESFEISIKKNPRLYTGYRPLYALHPARVFMPWIVKNICIEKLKKIYGGKILISDGLWLPYKLYNYIINKTSDILINLKVNHLMDVD